MKRWQVILALGLAGAASLVLVPIEALIETRMPVWQARLAMVAQPAVMIALAVWIGEVCAGRAGLFAPLIDAAVTGRGVGSVLRRQAPAALILGLAAAALLVAYSVWVGPHVAPSGELARFASFDMPLATKVLYGGFAEEILTRWALMSLIAWIGLKLSGGRAAAVVTWAAVWVAAVGFAVAHLPLLFLINSTPSPWVIAAVIGGNALPGAAFGWLFWRRGLEAAMLAHIVAHVGSTLVLAGLAGQ